MLHTIEHGFFNEMVDLQFVRAVIDPFVCAAVEGHPSTFLLMASFSSLFLDGCLIEQPIQHWARYLSLGSKLNMGLLT